MSYPPKLSEIIDFFQQLSDEEKRENLVAYADQTSAYEPQTGEVFDLEDERKDEECTDTVAIFLKVNRNNHVHFKVKLGPHVQTLTKAMAGILCEGLEDASIEEVLELPQDFVPNIVGNELVRVRSQTVYYILTRMKSACKVYQNRQRVSHE